MGAKQREAVIGQLAAAEGEERVFLFYWEGCSPSVGRVVEGVEAERLAIGQALGTPLTPFHNVMI